MDVHIRRASAADADAITDVWYRSRKDAIPAIPPPVHSREEIGRFIAEIDLVRHEVWVAEAGGELVAMMVLESGWIGQLYVAPGYTGRSIGTQLVELAKARQPDGLYLWTFVTNVGARRFYERHGFVVDGGTDGDNEEGEPDVRYRWAPATP